MTTFQQILILVAIVLAFGFVGKEDAKEAARDQIAYCESVKSGEHPDYEGTYEKECTADKLKNIYEFLR